MNKKKCLICGGLYSYCSSCYADRFKPAWYQIFCSEECKEIDGILSANTVGAMSDIEAKHKLQEISLEGKELHKQKVKDKINYFLSLEEPEKELNEIKEDVTEENTNGILVKENIDIKSVQESEPEIKQVEEEKPKNNKRRYSKNRGSNNKNE